MQHALTNNNQKLPPSDFGQTLNLILVELRELNSATNPILSLEGAVALTGIPKGTIYKMTSQNEIPFSKIGKRLMFNREELIAWVKSKSSLNTLAV